MPRRFLALAAALALALALAAPAAAVPSVAGSPGSGDPFFPFAGNGGYDVRDYSLELDYDQPQNFLAGHAVIRARTTEKLHRFNLDLRDFYAVSSVEVNGRPATFTHEGQELSISPRKELKRGEGFRVAVAYAGEPRRSSTRTARARAGSRLTTAPSS